MIPPAFLVDNDTVLVALLLVALLATGAGVYYFVSRFTQPVAQGLYALARSGYGWIALGLVGLYTCVYLVHCEKTPHTIAGASVGGAVIALTVIRLVASLICAVEDMDGGKLNW